MVIQMEIGSVVAMMAHIRAWPALDSEIGFCSARSFRGHLNQSSPGLIGMNEKSLLYSRSPHLIVHSLLVGVVVVRVCAVRSSDIVILIVHAVL